VGSEPTKVCFPVNLQFFVAQTLVWKGIPAIVQPFRALSPEARGLGEKGCIFAGIVGGLRY
jgi:hypothetical protein